MFKRAIVVADQETTSSINKGIDGRIVGHVFYVTEANPISKSIQLTSSQRALFPSGFIRTRCRRSTVTNQNEDNTEVY